MVSLLLIVCCGSMERKVDVTLEHARFVHRGVESLHAWPDSHSSVRRDTGAALTARRPGHVRWTVTSGVVAHFHLFRQQ